MTTGLVLPDSAVFDSNILIDFLNQRPEARSVIGDVRARYVSVVTRSELLVGIRDARSRDAAYSLLAMCLVCYVTVAVAEHAAALRQEHRLKLPDALIAATAVIHRLPLLTRDYVMGTMPNAIVPYRLQ